MKKILHISNYLYKGGAETVFRNTLKIFEHEYSQIIYTYYKEEERTTFLLKNSKFYKGENFREKNKIKGLINSLYSYKNNYNIGKLIDDYKPEIIHLHGYLLLSPSILKVIYRKKRKYNYKVIQTVHDYNIFCPNAAFFNYKKNKICTKCLGRKKKNFILIENCDYRNYFYSFLKYLRSKIEYYYYKKQFIDDFISPSIFMKNLLIKEGFNKEKIHLVRNPITVHYEDSSFQIKTKLNNILFVGRLSEEKNVINLVKAFSQIKDQKIKLFIIGDGPKKKTLEKYIEKNNLKNIYILGYLKQQKIFKIMLHSKVLILPSKCYENSPLVVLEALCHRTIPIVSNIGGMKELSNLFNIGITFDPNLTSQISEKILCSIYDYDEIIKKIDFSKLNDFSFEKYKKNMKKIYEGD